MTAECKASDQPQAYQLQYEAAGKLFDDGDTEKCIAEAKRNLSDTTLPPYYIIKNCILIACALDDWVEADIYRLSAEQAYLTSLEKATQKDDALSLEALRDLREELDELNEFRRQDLAVMVDEHVPEKDADMEEEEDACR